VYTQCSKCETVFKLSAEVLRTAGGQVRCGRCGEIFNALARLAEDSSAFAVTESAFELESRADSILESLGTPQVAQQVAEEAASDKEEAPPPGVEIARLEVLDWPEEEAEEPDSTVHESAPAAHDPANVLSDGGTTDAGAHNEDEQKHGASADANQERVDADAPTTEVLDDRSLEFSLPPGELDRIFVESRKREPRPPLEPILHPEPRQPAERVRAAVNVVRPRNRVGGFAAREFVRDREPDERRKIWLGGALVLVLLLMAQILHKNREAIAQAHNPLAVVMRAMYGALGSPLPAPANLAAYQLRQWGVTGDPDANGTLRLRASILNIAAQLQPYPLLRVTLADRFGKSIGRRDFEPAEYVGKPTARLLAPGERVDATLAILDPGKNAEGFEIDVCLRGIDKKIQCANDVATQAKR